MELKKPFNFLRNLPEKLNKFYLKNNRNKLKISNKSKKKKKFDPVTNLDKSFERYIRFLISSNFPNDSIIGEEFKEKKKLNNYQWAIDPIDGTKAFIIGSPTWSNLIGFSYKKMAILGLANFPDLKKFYISGKNNSYVISKNKKTTLKSSTNHNLKKIKVIGNFHNSLNQKKELSIIKKFGSTLKLASLDALNYCLLAEGKIDVVIEDNLKMFDILPLIPILQKSGAVVTTWKNRPAENGGNIIAASNKKLHSKILKLIKGY